MAICTWNRALVVALVISLIVLAISFPLALNILPDIVEGEIDKAVKLEEGTIQYERFEKLPFPLDFKAYIFHVENPDEILNNGKPKIVEKGPFAYKQYRRKNITGVDSDEPDSLTYRQIQTFEFDNSNSHDNTENDTFIVLNAPLMSMLTIAEDIFGLSGTVYDCILDTFNEEQKNIFISATAKELLLDGISLCQKSTPLNLGCWLINLVVCGIAASKRNIQPSENGLKFSFLGYKQDTDDGEYVVNRGVETVSRLGTIVRWNKHLETDYWNENGACNIVRGGDSTIYPPRIKSDQSFYIFSTDICRTVEVNYLGEKTQKGINVFEYGTNERTLYSSTNNTEEDCYCIKKTKDVDGNANCYLDGTVDMNSCFGVPVVLSFPHFLWADQKYSDAVDGLQADVDQHRIYLLVEPNTGTPLKGVKRIQINMPLRPLLDVTPLNNVSRVLLPLIWIEEGIELSDQYIDELNDKYFNKVKLVDGLRWSLIGIFAALSVVLSGVLIVRQIRKSKTK